MKRVLLSLVVLGTLMTSTATAQYTKISVGGGWMLPTGRWDYPRVKTAGWQLMGAVEVTFPRTSFGLRVDGMYGQIRYDDPFIDGPTKLSTVTADLMYLLRGPMTPLQVYLLAGMGYCVFNGVYHAAFAGGTGLSVGSGPLKVFVEGRFVTVRANTGALNFFPVTSGLSFGL